MFRSLLGFAIFAVFVILGFKILGALLGGLLGIVVQVAWFAFLGWIFYVLLKVFAPDTAAKVRETISGKPSSTA